RGRRAHTRLRSTGRGGQRRAGRRGRASVAMGGRHRDGPVRDCGARRHLHRPASMVTTATDGNGASRRVNALSATVLRSVLDQLSLAIFVFRGERLVYTNPPATRLINRLRTKYRIELLVMLLDHLAQFREGAQHVGTVIALTGQDNEPFIVHLMELPGRHDDVAV